MRPLLLVLLLAGCQKRADEGAHCEYTRSSLALDAAGPGGFTGADVAALATAEWLETLTWARGGTTGLTLTVGAPTGARQVDGELVLDGDTAIDLACPDYLEVDVPVAFVTADGAFDEAFAGRLTSDDGAVAVLSHRLDPYALGGTYDITADVDEPPPWEDATLTITARFDGVATSGAVAGQVEGVEVCEGDLCSAWAAEVDVGSWGALR